MRLFGKQLALSYQEIYILLYKIMLDGYKEDDIPTIARLIDKSK
jgi:hypothetical protein